MACYRCGGTLNLLEDKMVCSRGCGYERAMVKPAPSYTQLLEENERLKKKILLLESALNMYRKGTA